jgi:hypothetical protein
MGEMTGAHFIYIPAILLIGVVIGWILGSRAAADAYAVQAVRERGRNQQSAIKNQESITNQESRIKND